MKTFLQEIFRGLRYLIIKCHINTKDYKRDIRYGEEVKESIYFDKYENYGPYHWSAFVEHSFLGKRSVSLKIAKYVYGFSGRNKKILDIGCGDGFLSFVASINNNQVTAIDNNNEAILLSSKFAKYNARLKVYACSVEEFRSDEIFDSIICIDVIEHLNSPNGFLRVVKTNLKKGGTILVGTPLFISEDKVEKYHQKEYTAVELDRLLGTVVYKIRHRIFKAGLKRYCLYYAKKNG